MLIEGGSTPGERLVFAFRRATARRPSSCELDLLTIALERYLSIYRADLQAAKEFIHHGDSKVNENLDPADLAAYSALASIILNLDETITKE
jgi:hypothetical protein